MRYGTLACAVCALAIALGMFAVSGSLRAQVAAATPSTVADIRAELEAMVASDQENRKLIQAAKTADERKALWDKQLPIDATNQKRVEAIIQQVGWPGLSVYGAKASSAAFLVLQHAPMETKKRHFSLLEKAMEQGELRKESFALFDDRIRMNEGRPQRYGSQLTRDEKTDKLVLWPIEDEANVDVRRAKMGMPPLAQYAKFFGLDYALPASKTEAIQSNAPSEKK